MYDNILLTVDLSDDSSSVKALPTAVELARSHGGKLHVATVVPDMGSPMVGSFFPDGFEQRMVDETAAQLQALAKEKIPAELLGNLHVSSGTIYKEILRLAEADNVDLIVMASHRPELRDYLLGPNAARVVRHATCSVLVVRD